PEKLHASRSSQSTWSGSPFVLREGGESASTAAAAVESASEPSAVESAAEAATVEPAETRRAALGQAPGRTAVIASAECAPAAIGCAAWRRECMQLAAAGSGRAARAGGRTNVAGAMIRAGGVGPAPVSEA